MTREFHRHLQPDRTLIVDLGAAGRGGDHRDWYPHGDVTVNVGMNDAITETTARTFLDGLDVVYAAETWYRDDLCDIARDMGVATVLHAMPELYRRDQAQPDHVWVPTGWELDRMPPGTTVVPVPVARDRTPPRLRTSAHRFVFVGAPAFHDRNGLNLTLDAAALITQPVQIVFAGIPDPPIVRAEPGVDVGWEPSATGDYWDRPAGADVLVMPRRYAGLSLPMQEAAAAGMPIVTLDLAPQNSWVHPETLVHAEPHHPARMVHGTFWVFTAEPADIAKRINMLAADDDLVTEASQASLDHADRISWDALLPEYVDHFEWIADHH